MIQQAQIINWGSNMLVSKGYLLGQPPKIIIETPWSTVMRYSTTSGSFYLKQTPADLFIEADIIKVIKKHNPESPTPLIFSQNSEYHCFLMNSCGDYSLRTKFNGVIEENLLTKGLQSYIKIMRSFENDLDPLKAINVPDWGINRFPELLIELLDKRALMHDEGITDEEVEQLLKIVPKFKSICEILSEQKVKETLVNGDFNENNLIFNESTQQIAIIDWGESVITHPFLSIAGHLRNNARRYKLDMNGSLLTQIKQSCLSCWLDVAKMNELENIYEHTLKILPIFSVLALYRLQAATQNKSKEKQNWFMGSLLKTLLESD